MARRSARSFKTRLFGYQRKAVDAHLAAIDESISALQGAVDHATGVDQQDLILRATRRSVESVLQQAELDADRIRAEAHAEANQVLADANELADSRPPVIDLRRDNEDAVGADGDKIGESVPSD